jgi:hypothetical protein
MVRVCYNGCVDNTKLTRRASFTALGAGVLVVLAGCNGGTGSSGGSGGSDKKKSKPKKKK